MMKYRILVSLGVVTLLVIAGIGLGVARWAHAQMPHSAAPVGHGVTVHPSGRTIGHGRLMAASAIPQATAADLSQPHAARPIHTPWGAAKYAQLKAAARKANPATVFGSPITAVPPPIGSAKAPDVSSRVTTFGGLGYTGFIPSDMGMSVGGGYIIEAVEESLTVYNTNGVVQSGWPKTAQAFFGLPSHELNQPRVLFDPANGGHFWLLYNDFSSGTQHWYYQIAVSQTANPTGNWYFYTNTFDVIENANTALAAYADLPLLGLDAEAVYFTGNHFNYSSGLPQGAFVSWVNKTTMEGGTGSSNVTQMNDLSESDGLVDTLAPAISFGSPRAELMASVDLHASNLYTIFAVSNPLFTGGAAQMWNYQYTNIPNSVPPNAYQPGDTSPTMDTGYNNITSSPIWRDGILTFTFGSGVTQGSVQRAGVLFLRLGITLSDGNDTTCYPTTNRCVSIKLVYGLENGAVQYSGADNYYPSLAVDSDDNTIFTYSYSSTSRNASAVVYSRRSTTDRQDFGAPGATYGFGTAYYNHFGWGGYSAAAIDPASCTALGCYKIWVAGDYSNGDWATELTSVAYTLGDV